MRKLSTTQSPEMILWRENYVVLFPKSTTGGVLVIELDVIHIIETKPYMVCRSILLKKQIAAHRNLSILGQKPH
jgi:hypothetical protein